MIIISILSVMIAVFVTIPLWFLAFLCFFTPDDIQRELVENYERHQKNFPSLHKRDLPSESESMKSEAYRAKIKTVGAFLMVCEVLLVLYLVLYLVVYMCFFWM